MIDSTTPNPAAVHRGAAALTSALRISTLLPREQDAIFSILHSLKTADEWLPRLAGQPGSEAYTTRLLTAIGARRADRRTLPRAPCGSTGWCAATRSAAATSTEWNADTDRGLRLEGGRR